ncbi:hypothetical protein AOQ88_01210 [Candidatus Riesia sp. GBBU]|nr:hypothetical protein AOQ88_01210 [Candidatus Riesia sp. GBBU]
MMDKNNKNLINCVLPFLCNSSKILVGFSGGMDSSVLLHVLSNIRRKIFPKIRIRAIHINHHMSKNSDLWEKKCKKFCLDYKINFFSFDINLCKTYKSHGLESYMRKERYKIFLKTLLPNEILFTAHHLNDQVETFFLALKRGSGPKGLSSMPMSHVFGNGHFVRPFLYKNRLELISYARKNSLYWIEDENNCNDRYDRSFLRVKLIPLIVSRWPYILKSILRSSIICSEQEKLIREILEKKFNKITTKNGSIKIDELSKISEIKRNIILRIWFYKKNLLMPSKNQLKIIWNEVACANKSSNPKFIFGDKVIYRYKNQLWILPKFQDLTNKVLSWDLKEPVYLPDNLGKLILSNKEKHFRRPKKNERVTIRFGLKDSRIKLANSRLSKKKKRFGKN